MNYFYRVPDIKTPCRIFRAPRPGDEFFYVESEIPVENGIEVSQYDEVIVSHLEWWAIHPEDDPGWSNPDGEQL